MKFKNPILKIGKIMNLGKIQKCPDNLQKILIILLYGKTRVIRYL